MAEFVHQRTEDMINELEQLQRTGLFSAKEVKAVIKKRIKHEYKLVKRQKQKKDSLAYIQYEVNFLNLIHERRKREQYFFKNDEIEYVIVTRIHRVFKQALALWASDVKLWISHANFCIKWNKKTQLSKLCTRFLQIHGSKPEFWVLAAKWEIECCLSMENGRVIFMKGIKQHPDSKKLWLEFFRSELLFAEKLRRRMKVLASSDVDMSKIGKNESQLMQAGSALIAYRNAIIAIPGDSAFQVKFLKIGSCFLATSAFATDVIETIRSDLESKYPLVPSVRSELAKLNLNIFYGNYRESGFANKEVLQRLGERRCYEEFDDAVAALNTEEMWGEYVECVLSLCSDDQPLPAAPLGQSFNQFEHRLDQAYTVVVKAHAKRKLASKLYPPVVDFLLKHNHMDKARIMLSKISKERQDPVILMKKIELFLLSINGDIKWKSEKLFLSALETVDLMKAEEQVTFYRMWMEFAISHNQPKLAKQIVTTHSVQCASEAKSAMLNIYLRWLATKSGIETAYQVFTQDICHLRTPSLEQFKIMIAICRSLPNNDVIEECFDLALRHHGPVSIDLWIEYIRHCQNIGKKKAKKVSDIYWRAKNNLKPLLVEEFLTRFSLLGSHFLPESNAAA